MAGTHGRRVQLLVVRAALGTQQVRVPTIRSARARDGAVRAMGGAVHGFGQELGATINAETRAMKMPDKRVQAPMPVRYNSVRAGPHRPFCGGEGNDESIIHAVYNAPQMYPTYIVELELQMEASVQACLKAEVEQAGAPAAKRQRTGSEQAVNRQGTGSEPAAKRQCTGSEPAVNRQ